MYRGRGRIASGSFYQSRGVPTGGVPERGTWRSSRGTEVDRPDQNREVSHNIPGMVEAQAEPNPKVSSKATPPL